MKSESGQAILETALVLPILLLLLCGIIDFGRILYASNHLNMISQEAVRLAGFGRTDSEIVEFINKNVELNDKDTITVNVTPVYSERKSGDYATLNISYGVKYITPIINLFLPSPFVVNAQSTIRVE